MRYTAIILLSALSLTACKDDKLSSKSLLEGTGYGLLDVDLDEGVFSQTQINFKEFVGAECSQVVSELKKTVSKGSYVFQLTNFHSNSARTLVEANINTFVKDDCVLKTVGNLGVTVSDATKTCKGMEKTYILKILDQNDDGLATDLQFITGSKLTLDYDNLDTGFVSGQTFATKQQIDDFGFDKYWDSEYMVCLKPE